MTTKPNYHSIDSTATLLRRIELIRERVTADMQQHRAAMAKLPETKQQKDVWQNWFLR